MKFFSTILFFLCLVISSEAFSQPASEKGKKKKKKGDDKAQASSLSKADQQKCERTKASPLRELLCADHFVSLLWSGSKSMPNWLIKSTISMNTQFSTSISSSRRQKSMIRCVMRFPVAGSPIQSSPKWVAFRLGQPVEAT